MNKLFQKKQIFTIPNALSLFRIILIPLILYLYIAKSKYILTIAVIAVSGLTDIIDGRIARKYNMISDFGKILDPIADKLTEGALMICLLERYRLMWILLILFAVWETVMVILGGITVMRTGTVSSSLWFGKAATIVIYFNMAILILFPNIPQFGANSLIIICIIAVLNAFFLYTFYFWDRIEKAKEDKNRKEKRGE